jgi:hypothetical protein
MGRPPLHPLTQIFTARLATRLLVVTGVTSLALPAACGGGTASVTTTGSSTARGSGGAPSARATGTGGIGGAPGTTADGILFEAGIPADAVGPPPVGPDCFDWAPDAGPCPTDPNVIVFQFDKTGCIDAGDGITIEPSIVNAGPAYTNDQCCYTVQFQYCITGGRPYLVAAEARVAAPERGPGEQAHAWSQAQQPSTTGLGALTADERAALAAAWTADALLEHASVASFSRFSLALLAAGAPADLIARAHHAALDEVRHAELCFALASAYAGEGVRPGPFPVGARVEAGASLESLASSTVREGCIGETVAAVVAAEQLARATHPAVRAALSRIAEDEARHAELAWRTVAWAIEVGGAPVRDAVARAFREAHVSTAVPPMDRSPTTPTTLETHGRLDAAATARAVAAAMTSVVTPSARALLQRRPGAATEPS